MSECADLTYYQRNRDVILNRAETYLEKKKIKRGNVGRIDIAICLKKRKNDLKNIKKINAKLKNLDIIMNKIVL